MPRLKCALGRAFVRKGSHFVRNVSAEVRVTSQTWVGAGGGLRSGSFISRTQLRRSSDDSYVNAYSPNLRVTSFFSICGHSSAKSMFSGMRLAQNMVELIQQLRKLRVHRSPGDLEILTTPRLKVATLEDARFHTSSRRDGCLG